MRATRASLKESGPCLPRLLPSSCTRPCPSVLGVSDLDAFARAVPVAQSAPLSELILQLAVQKPLKSLDSGQFPAKRRFCLTCFPK